MSVCSNGPGTCVRFKHVRLESTEGSALQRIMWQNVVTAAPVPSIIKPERASAAPEAQRARHGKEVSGNSARVRRISEKHSLCIC